MQTYKPKLSLVIPCYNEAARFGTNIEDLFMYLQKQRYSFEVIFVDDGSTDATLKKLREYAEKYENVRIIEHVQNEGKGEAVRSGVLASTGEAIVFLDADMSTPIETLEQCWPVFKKGGEVIIGSRRHPDSIIKTPQPWLRVTLGHGFTRLTNLLLGLHVSDVTCGLKMLEARTGKTLFRLLKRGDWSFDAEMLFLARKRRMKIVEVPVVWTNVKGTKVHLLKDLFGSLWSLIFIRLKDR
ncbi:MAG: glycosyltransferase family 2 protein [bacterium]|nr:glycosyltransferase family 2 protein [bacterium]